MTSEPGLNHHLSSQILSVILQGYILTYLTDRETEAQKEFSSKEIEELKFQPQFF